MSDGVCHIRSSFYGLKQTPTAWFEKFQKTLQLDFFPQIQYDHSLFLRCTPKSVTILLVYVNNNIMTG